MTVIDRAWGAGPTPGYDTLAKPFRSVFDRIAEGALRREEARERPGEPIGWLKEAGFTRLRLPVVEGGSGATAAEVFALLIELSEADSNVTQALRAHFGFVEDIVNLPSGPRRSCWADRIARGETIGSAWTEVGAAPLEGFATRLTPRNGAHVLNGAKYYTTGSLFADWVDVGATLDGSEGETVAVTVRNRSAGLRIDDDWNGFGQIGTASGTAVFTDVAVADEDFVREEGRFHYSPAFYQLVHLATLAGIGRAITKETAALLAARRRAYSNATTLAPNEDPQLLQVVGQVRGAAYGASAIVLQAAQAIDRAFHARHDPDPAVGQASIHVAELEACQALPVVSNLILDAATRLFDALGASATGRELSLDRHWRNARTLTSHNPRVYKDRIVGDYVVNGTPPPDQWQIGTPASS